MDVGFIIEKGEFIGLTFMGASDSGKTGVYEVQDMAGGRLAEIRWKASWRGYAVYFETDTYFNKNCLKDLIKFLEIVEEMKKTSEIYSKQLEGEKKKCNKKKCSGKK